MTLYYLYYSCTYILTLIEGLMEYTNHLIL
nr:MAG TPA: hypothetical protein [Caudoviricetes sp.]